MSRPISILAGGLLLVAAGCSREEAMKPPPASADQVASVTDRQWILDSLVGQGQHADPSGLPITLRLTTTSGRAVGYGGCNRYNGQFTLTAEGLTIGPVVSTRMSCGAGDQLEQAYFTMLGTIRSWAISDSALVLQDDNGQVAARYHQGHR